MLATIGEKFATLEEAAFEDLPSASTTLYYLAKLDGAIFHELLEAGTIHCGLKLSEARELWIKFSGQPQQPRKINVKLRVKRFADFFRSTASEWKAAERELAADELTGLLDFLGTISGKAFTGNRISRTLITPCDPRTHQRSTL